MKYYLQARLMPTVITAGPLWLLINIILDILNTEIVQVNNKVPFSLTCFFFSASLFGLVQINRLISFIFQEIVFGTEMKMYAVTYLLWCDKTIVEPMKVDIHKKIFKDFNISVLSKDDENKDILNAREVLFYAIKQVTNSLRNCPLRQRYGLEYAFIRNFIGGCIVAVIISLALSIYAIINDQYWLFCKSLVLLISYTVPILFGKYLIKWFGRRYAKILLEQYVYGKSADKIQENMRRNK